jgi:UDP-N-acetylglucosamine 2-epimerase (non-hydrolysing)
MTVRRVMTIYGTRPEAIKMAPLVRQLRCHRDLECVVAVTGQHREMLDQVNDLFDIAPAHDLNLMTHGAPLSRLTSTGLMSVTPLLEQVKPDAVVVQGDTTTVLAAALAAFYQQIPVIHLEAGLRTHDLYSPFPEEANRRLASPLTALHLSPTATSRANLEREGIDPAGVVVTGNTVIDALRWAVTQPVTFHDDRVAEAVGSGRRLLLVTSHRRESWGAPMHETMRAVRTITERNPGLITVLPMHRNPVVREVIQQQLGGVEDVILTEPLSYHEFSHLLEAAHVVLTDSGGVQEEAPSLGKPVLVMRDTTERPEAVEAGTVKLVGTDYTTIVAEATRLLTDPAAYRQMANAVNPYGDGLAAPRAVAAIGELLGVGRRLPDFSSSVPIAGSACATDDPSGDNVRHLVSLSSGPLRVRTPSAGSPSPAGPTMFRSRP